MSNTLKYDLRLASLAAAALIGPVPVYGNNTTPRTYFDSSGIMQEAANNTPRLASHIFNGTSWVNRGYLSEEGSENLVFPSNDLSSIGSVRSSWAGTTTAPDGSSDANLLVPYEAGPTYQNGSHYGSFAISKAASALEYTWSAYVKDDGLGYFRFRTTNGASEGAEVTFDLSDGSILSGPTNGVFSNSSADSEDVGNGWYRVWVTFTTDTTTTLALQYRLHNGTADAWLPALGVDDEGVYIWGAQLELGPAPSSLIPTTSGSVTRNADVLKIANADLAGIGYSDTDVGTFIAKTFTGYIDDQDQVVIDGSFGSGGPYLNRDNTGPWQWFDGTAKNYVSGGPAVTNRTEYECAIGYDGSSAGRTSVDGSAVLSSAYDGNWSLGANPIGIGCTGDSEDNQFNGHITELRFWDEQLDDADLQAPPSFSLFSSYNKMGIGIGFGIS